MTNLDSERPKRSWWSSATGLLKESGALVGAVLTLITAAAGLMAFFGRAKPEAPLPVLARLEGPGGVSERAFFTPSGDLVSTQYANQKGLSVHWRGRDGDRNEAVEVDRRSDGLPFTLLHLDGESGPKRDLRRWPDPPPRAST